jgi:hypothetical protein
MQNLIWPSHHLLKPTYNSKMQRADPTLLVLIDEIVSAADLDRSLYMTSDNKKFWQTITSGSVAAHARSKQQPKSRHQSSRSCSNQT